MTGNTYRVGAPSGIGMQGKHITQATAGEHLHRPIVLSRGTGPLSLGHDLSLAQAVKVLAPGDAGTGVTGGLPGRGLRCLAGIAQAPSRLATESE